MPVYKTKQHKTWTGAERRERGERWNTLGNRIKEEIAHR